MSRTRRKKLKGYRRGLGVGPDGVWWKTFEKLLDLQALAQRHREKRELHAMNKPPVTRTRRGKVVVVPAGWVHEVTHPQTTRRRVREAWNRRLHRRRDAARKANNKAPYDDFD